MVSVLSSCGCQGEYHIIRPIDDVARSGSLQNEYHHRANIFYHEEKNPSKTRIPFMRRQLRAGQ
ncbi:MAG: hypothetical protein AMJ54_15050 [Deltaproteobacteria bacterium SG8_13]|nr:MAG: hypothetical protein AMJ54_15050 [Deltaproteobacteria bacterium SG8_13]